MFSKEGFIEACGAAVKEGQTAVRELVQERYPRLREGIHVLPTAYM